MKKILLISVALFFTSVLNSFSQELEKMTAYAGVYEYSDTTDSQKFFAFEAAAGTIITKIVVRYRGNIIASPRATFIGDNDTLKVGGLYFLPKNYIGDTLTVKGTIKKIRF